jgi:beta-lactamase class A
MRTILSGSGVAKKVLALMLVFSLFMTQQVFADASAAEARGKLTRLETILQPIIDAAEDSGVEVAVAIKDLSGTYGGESLLLGSTDPYLAASTIKIAIITALMQDVEAGLYSLEDTVTVTPEEVVGGAGTLQNEEFPQDVSLYRLAELMIIQSDNTATNVLIDLLGFERVEALIDELGFEVMQLGRKMMTTAKPPKEENYVNAKELLTLLELIYNGEIVSEESRDQILAWMKNQQVKTKFGAALAGKPIAHKTGELGDVSHDVGYFLEPGKEIAIVVLTKVIRPEDSGKAQDLGNPVVQRIAKAVYNFLLDSPSDSSDVAAWPEMALTLLPIIDQAQREGIRVSVGLKDLSVKSQKEVVFGSKQAYAPASTIKMALVTALMRQVDRGVLSLEDQVTVKPEDVVGGTGSLQYETFPQDVTIERLARLMITQSDNTATNVLIDVVGLDTVQELMEDLGLEVMHLGRKMFASAPTPQQDNYINAADLNTLLGVIYEGDLLSQPSRELILEWMKAQEVKTKFGAVLPDVVKAHKTGENANVTHDTGYFLIPGNETAVTVLTEVTTTGDFNTAQEIGNALVQRIAVAVYETLVHDFAYTDVAEDDEARPNIEAVTGASLINGTSETTFSPDLAITREQFASMLVRSLGLKSDDSLLSFTDVPADSPYAGEIAAAVQAGIVNGKSDDSFGFGDAISRAEMVTMLIRAYEHENGAVEGYPAKLPYEDSANIPDWAFAAVAKAIYLGLADGYAEGTYRPSDSVTRGEAAKTIVEFRAW